MFYLPVVTPWWFDNVILPLIRTTAAEAEVHVLIPPLWRNTGITPRQLEASADIEGVCWHVIDDPDHSALRTRPGDARALIDVVRKIGPDYTICRSADVTLPRTFPGKTCFLMEADYPPFVQSGLVRLSGFNIFDHGAMAPLTDQHKALLMPSLEPLRNAFSAQRESSAEARSDFLTETGLPCDRPIVAMPLEHDGSDNFYMLHSPSPVNGSFVEEVAAGLAERCVLALTVHPAQRDDPAIMARLSKLADDRVRILSTRNDVDLTPALARHCDGMIFRDSKSITWAAMFEKPLFRRSRFTTGAWLNAYSSLACFDTAIGTSSARRPGREDALLWLAFHLSNDAFRADDPEFCLADLIDRIDHPLNPTRWTRSLARRAADLSAAVAIISIGA